MRLDLGGGAVLRTLAPGDEDEIQGVADRSLDYMLLADGEPAAQGTGAAFLRTGPPDNPDATHRLGIEVGGRLVGLVEMPADYPGPGDWFVALLLIEPAARGAGLGRRTVEAIVTAAGAAGARRIELSVLDENAAAARFWRSLGFSEVDRMPPARFGRKTHTRTVFERRLSTPA